MKSAPYIAVVTLALGTLGFTRQDCENKSGKKTITVQKS